MIDVLKAFYSVHYNFAIICILLIFLIIFFINKKNYVGMLIVIGVVLAINVGLYKRTEGKAWTLVVEDESAQEDEYGLKPPPKTMTFSALKDWTITDNKGVVHHWCWVDQKWEEFSEMDLVSKIWGSNNSKKMVQASESHISGN